MAIVTEISWDDMFAGKSVPESSVRQAWRQAVTEIADKAKATLPQCNGRVEKAVAIVLNGDVELLPEGKAKVASQSNGTTKYFLVNGTCECADYPKAPQNFCKHRLAYGIHKRAYALAKTKLDQLDSAQHAPSEPTLEHANAEASSAVQGTVAMALPEAPASANVHVMLSGRQVQVTLRDSDEQRLLERLERLLQRFPVTEESTKHEPSPGWCSTHGVQMKHKHSEKGSWWFHKTADGWCHGK